MPIHFDANTADELLISYLDSSGPRKHEALESLLEVVRPFVAELVDRHVAAPDREDATQEIVIHLERILPRYNRKKSDLRAWLSAIILNKTVSLYRHKKVHGGPEIADADIELVEEPDRGDAEIFVDALNGWLEHRYPSLDPAKLRLMSEIVVSSLINERSVKSSVAALVRHDRSLSSVDALQVYDSSLVFLRMISYSKSSDWKSSEQEFSFIPELRLLLGDDMFSVFYTLFKGTHIVFRDPRQTVTQN